MLKSLYLEERRHEIFRQISETGRVSVMELSRQYGVSEVTIRADLKALEQANLLVRTHGGALPATRGLYDLSLRKRLLQQVAEKNLIGKAAAGLINNGDAIFLDTSSTALAIAQRLFQHRDLTIITNSLAVAQEMLDVEGVQVVMPGGALRRDTASLIGTDGLRLLKKYNIQKGFFGAHGLSLIEGLTDVSSSEAEVKRPLIGMCRKVFAVLDATKWGRVGLASFAPLEAINTIITDSLAPKELLSAVRDKGIEVILV